MVEKNRQTEYSDHYPPGQDYAMIPDEDYEWAEQHGICVNCWHTLKCDELDPAGPCNHEDNSMEHECPQ